MTDTRRDKGWCQPGGDHAAAAERRRARGGVERGAAAAAALDAMERGAAAAAVLDASPRSSPDPTLGARLATMQTAPSATPLNTLLQTAHL